MKFEKRYKRLMDIMEKLDVAGAAVGIFQGKPLATLLGIAFLVISIVGTKEN